MWTTSFRSWMISRKNIRQSSLAGQNRGGPGRRSSAVKMWLIPPFLVINADDYYGKSAFREAYDYLTTIPDTGKIQICMVSFVLKNTLSDNGGVTRGLCKVTDRGC